MVLPPLKCTCTSCLPHTSIYDHHNITGHPTTDENFSTVQREDQNLTTAITEAVYTRVNGPSPNRNIGKCCIPHIWNEVLLNTSQLKLK